MTIYLPLALEAYNKIFSNVNQKQKAKVQHNVYEWRDETIVSPQQSLTDAATPASLIDLKRERRNNELLIVDRVHSSEPIIQIIDHRNLTGINPLIGKTPLDGRPRFPDVSKLYNKTENGFQKKVVNCVGPGRFEKKRKQTDQKRLLLFRYLPLMQVGESMLLVGTTSVTPPEVNFIKR